MKLETLTQEEFGVTITKDWAEYFQCKPKDFEVRGSHFIKRKNYAKNLVIIAHVDRKTFIQYNPALDDKIMALAEQCPKDLAITADHLVSYYENKNILIDCLDNMFYLYPPDLKLFTPDEKFTVRKLLAEDEKYLTDLNNSCPEEEVDNSFVEIDELGVWGCFVEDKLVAATGFSDWGLYGDFGVITHPGFRKQGLAKAAVSHACKEAIEIGKIPIYRCHITLFPSINTAKTVGFKKYPNTYFKMEVLKFVEQSEG